MVEGLACAAARNQRSERNAIGLYVRAGYTDGPSRQPCRPARHRLHRHPHGAGQVQEDAAEGQEEVKQDSTRTPEEMAAILADRKAFFAQLQKKWGITCVVPE